SGRLEPPRKTDLAVENDRIAAVGADLPEERIERVIDAEGLLLAPGFIDPHASTGFGFFFPQAADHKLYQGITTEIFGNCGTSTAPVGEGLVATMERLAEEIGFPFEWSSLGEYFSAVEKRLQFNIGSLIGHSTLRQGYVADWNNPRPDEQKAMEAALAKSMEEGALGLSTGLIYAPGCFAPTGEIVGLARVAKRYGGVYASHIRDERDRVEEAVEEALTIGRQADIPVLVSHLKAAERKNWGKIPRLLERI
ncbi:MAG: amidohydrolase family protein, partial [Saprospiraceae bacterium]|nr:amidohydrolase family protein [Saprospiraceae bacterium]